MRFFSHVSTIFPAPKNGEEQSLNSLPEGEPLLFQVQLGEENLTIVGGVLTEYKDGALLASFRDFISTLGFPIEVADDGSAAEGWYIKEGQKFFLDVNAGVVHTRSL